MILLWKMRRTMITTKSKTMMIRVKIWRITIIPI